MKKYFKSVIQSQMYMIKRIWGKERKLFFTGLFSSVINGLIPTIDIILMRRFVENLENKLWIESLMSIGFIFLFHCGMLFCLSLIDFFNGDAKSTIRRGMWVDLFRKTSEMDDAIFRTSEISDLYQEARGATQNNRCMNIVDSFYLVLSNTITIFSTLAVAFVIDFWVFIVVVGVLIIQAFITIRERKMAFQTWKEDAKLNKEVTYYMGLLFDRECANDMKMNFMSDWIVGKFNLAANKQKDLWRDNSRKSTTAYVLNSLLNYIQQGVLYIFLAFQMVFKSISYADFTVFFSAINTFSAKLKSIFDSVINIVADSFYIEAYKRYMEIENVIAVESDESIRIDKESEIKNIVFENVTFSYPQSEDVVLKNVNLCMEAGKTYVIVGQNGAGKTTFLKLLCRLYDPVSGGIYLDGKNINAFYYKDYRALFGTVFQNYRTYEFSLAENIAMNDFNETIETFDRIGDVCERVGLAQKVSSLPDGIMTSLGTAFDDEGVYLSGGEGQKVALARALFQDKPILVLDEPASALDAFAEDELIRTFINASKNKTVFYISHRLSVAKYADKVIFIDQNGVSGFDTHDNLMNSCARYRDMYETQAKHYR